MNLYQTIETLMNTKITKEEIEKTIRIYIKVEGKKKQKLIEASKNINENASNIFNCLIDIVADIQDKQKQLTFKDQDIRKIFDVSLSTVKNWRTSGALQYEQPNGAKSSIKITSDALDAFVLTHRKYRSIWESYKK